MTDDTASRALERHAWRLQVEIDGARLEADGVGTPPFDVLRVLNDFLDAIGGDPVIEDLTHRLRATNVRVEGKLHGFTDSTGTH